MHIQFAARRPARANARARAWLLPSFLLAAMLAGCGNRDGDRAAATEGLPETAGQIDQERLVAVQSEPGEWLTGGRDFGKTHYSPLETINRDTVARLGFAWELQTGTSRGMEATPIVVDGVMYVSGVAGRVYALDAATGAVHWQFEPAVDNKVNRGACCDMVNRGVAVWRGKVYVAAFDGILYALGARDGKVLWQADTIIDRQRGYSVTGAPQVAGKVVVIGNGGAEFDARGYVTAYDLESGELTWRFFTVPGDPKQPFEHPELEQAAKTWDPDSRWEFGLGGTAWDSLAYDPELNLLYVGTGNAALWSRSKRSPRGGDNLFLASILAINPDDGKLAWYYQQVPGEQWDYTATQPLVLSELTLDGRRRKVLMQAPKNGFFYVLDRETGELLSADPFESVTWATHVDLKTGRPAENKALADYGDGKPKLVFPSPIGAHNWNPMSHSARTGLVYIPTIHVGAMFMETPNPATWLPGRMNTNVQTGFSGQLLAPQTLPPAMRALASPEFLRTMPDVNMSAALKAWDPVTRKVVWTFTNSSFMDHGGVLSTAGGLVVQGGLDGVLRVLNDETGAVLKEIDVGTAMIAAPMTYSVGGVQYVAILAGSGGGGWSSWMPQNVAYRNGNANRILVFRLDGGVTPKPEPLPPPGPIPQPPTQTASAAQVGQGAELFARNCASCHLNVVPAPIPDLRRSGLLRDIGAFQNVVRGGALQPRGMPRFDDVLSAEDVAVIHAHLVAIANAAYDEQQKTSGAPPSSSGDPAPSTQQGLREGHL
jgi:quinohemoprotein ethanol dehydrogenase